MAATSHYLGKFLFGVGRRVGVGFASKLLSRQTCFVERAGRGVADVFTKDWKRTPQGKRLEGKDDFHTGLIGHLFDKREIPAQESLFEKVIGSIQF